jgi:hypothetical protein
MGGSQFRQKVLKTPVSLNKKLHMVAHTCHHSFTGNVNGGDHSSGLPSHKARPYLKNSQSKMDWGCDSSCRVPA